MKTNISEKVVTLPPSSATHNQALLQKLRLDFQKVSGQLKESTTEERVDSTNQQEEEAPAAAKLSRRHYKCHMCNKYYLSIGQHLTRKHKSLDNIQKCMLRKNMLSCKTLSAPPPDQSRNRQHNNRIVNSQPQFYTCDSL